MLSFVVFFNRFCCRCQEGGGSELLTYWNLEKGWESRDDVVKLHHLLLFYTTHTLYIIPHPPPPFFFFTSILLPIQWLAPILIMIMCWWWMMGSWEREREKVQEHFYFIFCTLLSTIRTYGQPHTHTHTCNFFKGNIFPSSSLVWWGWNGLWLEVWLEERMGF